MAIIQRSALRHEKRRIDLSGPEGNAFALLGLANSLAKQIGMEKEDIDNLIKEMTSGDYENLIKVFDREFGMIYDLVR